MALVGVAVALALDLGIQASLPRRGFPLPLPTEATAPKGTPRPQRDHCCREVPDEMRTRLVERAVARSGGWNRWKRLAALAIKQHRRSYDSLGQVSRHLEDSLVYTPDSLTRYRSEGGNPPETAVLRGRHLVTVTPHLPVGAPEAVEIQRELEREQFWLAHPFVLNRPGLRTRYLGLTTSRGAWGHLLLASYDPGASPYRKVEYLFHPSRGDLMRAVAHPGREGDPVETYHWTGRSRGHEGLRLPRRRELVVDGLVREVVTVMALGTDAPVLGPAQHSVEARTGREALPPLRTPSHRRR